MVTLQKRKKSFKYLAMALVIVLAGGGYWLYAKSNVKKDTITISQKVKRWAIENVIQTTGTAEIIDDQKLRFNQLGTVYKVYKKEWSTVKKDELIAELDKTDLNNSIKQAQVALDNSQIQLSQKLHPAEKDVLKASTDVDTAKNNLASAQNDLSDLQTQRDNDLASIRSSIASAQNDITNKETELQNAQSDLAVLKTQESKGVTNSNVDTSSSLTTAYINAKKYFNDADNTLDSIDMIFGITNAHLHENDDYENYLSAKNTNLKNSVSTLFWQASTSLASARTIYNGLSPSGLTGDNILSLYAALSDMENTFISLSKTASDSIDASFATAVYPQSQIDSQKNSMQQSVSTSQQNLTNITTTNATITKLNDPTLIKQQSDSNIAKQELQVKSTQDQLSKLRSSLNDLQNNLVYKTSQYASQIQQKQFAIDSAKSSISINEANLAYLKSWGTSQDIALLKNSIAKQQLSLESSKKQAKNYELRAPFDGIINQIDFKNGDNIVADDSKYVYIQNPNLVRITALLDQLDIAKTSVGQKVSITFDSYPKKKFEWTVTELNPAAVITSGVTSYQVRITLDRGDTKIYSGMTAVLSIIIESKNDVLTIPTTFITKKRGTSTVLISESGANVSKEIKTGISTASITEIVSGLSEGDTVVREVALSGSGASSQRSLIQLPGGGGGNRGGAGGGAGGGGRNFGG